MKTYEDPFHHIIINNYYLIIMNHQLVNWTALLSITPVVLVSLVFCCCYNTNLVA